MLALIKSWVCRRGVVLVEFCHICGRRQPLVWWCESSELWKQVTGVDGDGVIYCPDCFDAEAIRKGILIRWTANKWQRKPGAEKT